MQEPLFYREATVDDIVLLAGMNQRLLADEGRRDSASLRDRESSMAAMLAAGYVATLFIRNGHVVAYALWRDEEERIDLRQFYVERMRRREGVGRAALGLLLDEIWPPGKRILVNCLVGNDAGLSFWRAMDYADYLITLEMERP